MNRAIPSSLDRCWEIWLPGLDEPPTFLGSIEAECEEAAQQIARLAYGPQAVVTRQYWSPAGAAEPLHGPIYDMALCA